MTSISSIGAQGFLKTTHQNVAWFWKALRDDELVLQPPFQRNAVWTVAQQAYLLDTILHGYPVPELYLQTRVDADGKQEHIVVDGQQRVRACLEFIDNRFALGSASGHLEGLKFKDLEQNHRQAIFEYTFVVRNLPSIDEAGIREIFGRLNRNNVALNAQEIRHATYWGEFITSMRSISEDEFWATSGVFTSNDIRRMLDIEFVSELTVGMLFGLQNKKASLDKFYAAFELDFPEKERTEVTFSQVLGELTQLLDWPSKLRWSKKTDFYTLFLCLAEETENIPFDKTTRENLKEKLTEFSMSVNRLLSISEGEQVDVGPEERAALSYARGVRASSDLGSRKLRANALRSVLFGGTLELGPDEKPEHDLFKYAAPYSGLETDDLDDE